MNITFNLDTSRFASSTMPRSFRPEATLQDWMDGTSLALLAGRWSDICWFPYVNSLCKLIICQTFDSAKWLEKNTPGLNKAPVKTDLS